MIEEKVISMALRNLAAAGCKYYVIEANGTAHLNGIEEDQIRKHKGRGPCKGPRRSWDDYDYIEKIKAMAVGDVIQFKAKDGDAPVSLQKVVSSSGHRFFGSNNFATAITDGVVEIIRLA